MKDSKGYEPSDYETSVSNTLNKEMKKIKDITLGEVFQACQNPKTCFNCPLFKYCDGCCHVKKYNLEQEVEL